MSLVVSLALHGVVLGALSFKTPDSTDSTADDRANKSAFDLPAIEIVQIHETVEPLREVEVVSLRPVVTTPAPEPRPEPALGMPRAAAGGESAAPAAATEVAEVGIEARIALSMRPQFATQRSLSGSLHPLEAINSHAGHDHEEDDGDDEGDSFWRRLGVPLGSGGGKVCKPRRPPVVIHK